MQMSSSLSPKSINQCNRAQISVTVKFSEATQTHTSVWHEPPLHCSVPERLTLILQDKVCFVVNDGAGKAEQNV